MENQTCVRLKTRAREIVVKKNEGKIDVVRRTGARYLETLGSRERLRRIGKGQVRREVSG